MTMTTIFIFTLLSTAQYTAFAGLPMQRDQFVQVAQCPTSHEASMMENQHQGMLILNWKGTRAAATGRGKHPRTLP